MTIVDEDLRDFMPTHPFVRGPSVTLGPLAAAHLEQRERAKAKKKANYSRGVVGSVSRRSAPDQTRSDTEIRSDGAQQELPRTDVWLRRNPVTPVPSGEGPVTERRAAVQPRQRERLKMPRR